MRYDGGADYAALTLFELDKAYAAIDRHQTPVNHSRLLEEYERRGELPPDSRPPPPPESEPEATFPAPRYDEHGRYRPNEVPLGTRIGRTALAVLLLIWGGVGVWRDRLVFPQGRLGDLPLSGQSAWIMFGAIVCGSLVLLSAVVDHYDRRDNEAAYRRFASVALDLAIFAALLALAMTVWSMRKG